MHGPPVAVPVPGGPNSAAAFGGTIPTPDVSMIGVAGKSRPTIGGDAMSSSGDEPSACGTPRSPAGWLWFGPHAGTVRPTQARMMDREGCILPPCAQAVAEGTLAQLQTLSLRGLAERGRGQNQS